MKPQTFARAIVSIEENYGLRLDARSAWLRLDGVPCGKGWNGIRGQCERNQGKWSGGTIQTGGFSGLEPGKMPDQKSHAQRIERVTKLADVLEVGRFKDLNSDNERTRYGKAGALTALREAKNPRVGLIAAKNKDGQPVGFMSYKPGRSSIEIQNFGTDQSEKGIGKAMFQNLLSVASKLDKGLTVAPTDDAIGFYEKMGMTKENDGALFMTAKQVKQAHSKL